MRRSVMIVVGLSACALAHTPAGAPKPSDSWLAIDFHTAPGLTPVVHDGAVHACVKLMLRPEDGGESKGTWEVLARVQHPVNLPVSSRAGKKAESRCATAGGTFVRLDKLQRCRREPVSP